MTDALTRKTVQVTQWISVALDEAKFTPEFMEEFRASFYPFHTIEEHREHLAQAYARGVIDGWKDEFVEGYGPLSEFGIAFRHDGTEVESSHD